jgi:hypothetical protein
LFPTDNGNDEIRYGSDGETDVFSIENILTMPLSQVDFDRWLDRQMVEALAEIGTGDTSVAGD